MPKKPNSLVLPFLRVEPESPVPLHEQIYTLLRDAIRSGALKPGLRLPSSREVAAQAGVGRNTATHAFARLNAEGFVRSTSGSGTYVAFAGEALPRPRARHMPISEWSRASARAHGASAGLPHAFDTDSFPWKSWRDAMNVGWRAAQDRTSSPADAGGLLQLRDAIAEYVAVMRGIVCSADEVIITTGAREAIAAMARLVADPGDTIVSDSVDDTFLDLFRAAGLLVKTAAVDECGLDLGETPATAPKLAFLVPSCEGPEAVVMSAGRRYAVIEWAKKHGTAIIEYDFDTIVDGSSAPLTPLKAIDRRDRVAFVGSFDTAILPPVRIGFAIVPAVFREAFLRVQAFQSIVPFPADQLALAWFIRRGLLARHVRRLRKVNDQRRTQLVAGLTCALAGSIVALQRRIPLQLEITLGPGLDAAEVRAAAAERGIDLRPLPDRREASELILDYGRLSLRCIPGVVSGLAAAFEEAAPRDLNEAAEQR